jgi:hypothetical protein
MGILNAIFAPFIILYLLMYSFFRYFEVREILDTDDLFSLLVKGVPQEPVEHERTALYSIRAVEVS